MMPKGIILLLKQLLPDFDAEKLAAQLTQAQEQLPAFIAALQAKIESIDNRLARIENVLRCGEIHPAQIEETHYVANSRI